MRIDGKIDPLILGLLLLLAGGIIYAVIALQPKPATEPPLALQSATLLPELRSLPPFSLVDQQGRAYDNRRLQNHWTLLSFGYTHCPDICPTSLAMLAQMKQQLQQKGMQDPYEIAFVSVDPERDTPQQLGEYVAYFDPDFLGLTGTPSAIEELARPLGILYRKVITEGSAMDYVMDHSASMVLLDPQGRYRALFSPPHDAAMMAQDILAISQGAEGETK
ncbi:MAG: SCO family protein [Candidatus Thiodiazotropha sp.]